MKVLIEFVLILPQIKERASSSGHSKDGPTRIAWASTDPYRLYALQATCPTDSQVDAFPSKESTNLAVRDPHNSLAILPGESEGKTKEDIAILLDGGYSNRALSKGSATEMGNLSIVRYMDCSRQNL